MVTATKRERSPSRRLSRRPAEVTNTVRPVAQSVADAHGLVLWSVGFRKDAGRETLRVSVDRAGGIGSDDLALFAEQLSRELDRADVVPGDASYTLDVSTPGAERKLETPDHFRVCIGRVAKVTLRDGRRVQGSISEVTDHAVEIEGETGSVRTLFSDIAKAQLVVTF